VKRSKVEIQVKQHEGLFHSNFHLVSESFFLRISPPFPANASQPFTGLMLFLGQAISPWVKRLENDNSIAELAAQIAAAAEF
jgi:hypothetical protein